MALRFKIIYAILIIPAAVMAQGSLTVRGTVYDEKGEPLVNASVIHLPSGRGASTGQDGTYTLKSNPGTVKIRVSYLGYASADTIADIVDDLRIDFYLQTEAIQYEEVTVTSEGEDAFVSSVRMGDVTFSGEELNRLPKLLGEADPIRFLQLTPGVQSGSEGGVGFFVRGGDVDQNLVLYGDALLYNPGHLLGFISVFNPDIISRVRLIKAGIPARFGGRLSSVLEVNPARGRSDSLRVKGQVGLVASRISVNRSFANSNGSFIFSARRASIDLFVKPVIFPLLEDVNPFLQQSSYNFYDLSGGVSYRLGDKDYINFTGFYGTDQFGIERSLRIAETWMEWGNFILSGSWDHLFSDQSVLSTSVSRTDYNFDLTGSQAEFIFSLLSSVRDYKVKSVLDLSRGAHRISLGYELIHHSFTPNEIDVEASGLAMNFLSYNRLFGYEGGLFIEDEIELNQKVSLSAGLRYSFFNQVGPYTEYVFNETSLLTDSVSYPAGQSLAFYHHPEPRLSIKYQIDAQSSLKASFMHMAQYLHLATSATISLPTDIWLPSSSEIQPQYGEQYSAGYFTNLLNNNLEASVEIYYKQSRNQIEFLRGVISNSLNQTLMDNLVVGRGRSYGAEFFVRKKTGKLTGWTGYTLSRSVRLFDMINNGKIYPARFDRRHDISFAGIYELNNHWDLSMVFVYVSGSAFTIPVGRYIIEGNLVNQYGRVNSFRMPPYNRLDLSATYTEITRRGNTMAIDFSVYNAYNRSNPFYIYFEATGDLENYQLEVNPVIVSLFPVIPSVSWRFEF